MEREQYDKNLTEVTQDEPKIENDYANHTEIEQPNPASATPAIPQEMPVR